MPRTYTAKIEHACEHCGKVRLYRPSEIKKFCSHTCYAESRRGVRTGFRINKRCRQCGENFVKLASQIGHYCSRPCADAAKVQPIEERFWAKVNQNGPTVRPELGACWLWIGGIGHDGYGKFWLRGRMIHAQRAAYELTYGPLTAAYDACHKCDNPPCVRPDHLFAGTKQDNSRDMVAKGRNSKARPLNPARGERHGSRTHPERLRRGAQHPNAKVTEEIVRAIRQQRAAGVPLRILAEQYDITQTQTSNIALGHSWRHVK